MALLLISWHNKHLANSVPFFDSSEFEYVFGKDPNKHIVEFLLLGSLFLYFLLLIDGKVLPLLIFLIDKGNTINIEKEQNLKSLLVRNKLFIISEVTYNKVLFLISSIAFDMFSFRNVKFILVCLFLQKLLFFHKPLPPPVIVCSIVTPLLA